VGIGTELIRRTLEVARRSYPAVSLSVRAGSRAEVLYRRLGFRAMEGTEVTNRAGGISYVMVTRFGY
jgi:predicted GNAT family N-acyltransferase